MALHWLPRRTCQPALLTKKSPPLLSVTECFHTRRQGLCAFKGSTGGLSQPPACLLNTYRRCALVRTVFPNSPNSPEFDPIGPNQSAGACLTPGIGAKGATVSSQWLYRLPQPRPHLWHYLFRHRYEMAPIGAAAPFPDLMVSRIAFGAVRHPCAQRHIKLA